MDEVSIRFLVGDLTYRLETEGSSLLITEGRGDKGMEQPSVLLLPF